MVGSGYLTIEQAEELLGGRKFKLDFDCVKKEYRIRGDGFDYVYDLKTIFGYGSTDSWLKSVMERIDGSRNCSR